MQNNIAVLGKRDQKGTLFVCRWRSTGQNKGVSRPHARRGRRIFRYLGILDSTAQQIMWPFVFLVTCSLLH